MIIRHFLVAGILTLLALPANAALVGRVPATSGGADFRAYYDTVLDVTWLADANYALTSGHDADGLMTWSESVSWVNSLNGLEHLGSSTWRLPEMVDKVGGGRGYGCDFAYADSDCGFNVDTSESEFAHLFYETLGNVGYYDAEANGPLPDYGLSNTGPFTNFQTNRYWYQTEWQSQEIFAWYFRTIDGWQNVTPKNASFNALAVMDGDIGAAVVPIPAAVWLFASGLGLLGWMRRKTA